MYAHVHGCMCTGAMDYAESYPINSLGLMFGISTVIGVWFLFLQARAPYACMYRMNRDRRLVPIPPDDWLVGRLVGFGDVLVG